MQQIVNFLFKNSITLLFLLLLGISLTFTIQSHAYHRSQAVSSANAVTGYTSEQINNVEAYFGLREQNEQLAAENAQLKRLLYNTQDSTNRPPVTLPTELGTYKVIQSKVIINSYSKQDNYLTISSGAKDGIKPDMGVVSSQGVIGYIENTSAGYATVISVLNSKFRLGAKIKKNNHFGTLTWNGKNTGFAQLVDVPRLATVIKGDTIVTGAESTIFPENIPIGTIEKVYIDKKTNYYTLDIRLFNDMTSLGYIYVIENKDKKEIEQLQQATTNE
ncbi:rod shape-determining protein MreC [Flavobacterium subsaxonicum]|uniref:Cell shape-determining protein MreC n=1 Tax=Flavobacterium subsaxonicum WB 4.1-42 = DSM 21790 TaxID=1121898 RepID=A0A0A2MRQ1_9FLAO|nr:rod shape-determining protein MreC [Flavobacterium subsaxonicum]KGO94133.1 rod shape-determining protein MreC [Flavobacterium subsaxonicum WB 4.1-42 = DSM 21790]